MRMHSLEKIKKLKYLRKRGYSINELVEALSIPKTTVWHHTRNVAISPKYASLLKSKRGGSAKRKQRNITIAVDKSRKLLKSKNREALLIIAMLYWAEGSKKTCEFINSDGKMIQLYLRILREVLHIQEDYLKATMRIFTGMKETECLSYWSKITEIPKNKFTIRYNDGGKRGKTQFGMCRIGIKKGSNILKLIHALTDQVSDEILKVNF